MRVERTLQEACGSCLSPSPGLQQQRGDTKGKAVCISAARLVNAVCNGLPDGVGRIDDPASREEWRKTHVIHVCCQCNCVNPRHLLWGNNRLNASRNKNNSYQTVLNARGDDRIDIASMILTWTTKAQAGNVVGRVEQGA